MPFTAETCVAMHLGDRKEQQDRVALFGHPKRPGMMMAVLADGMGGHSGGAMAAEQVLIRARQNFEAYAPLHETPEHLLRSVIDEAHVVIKLTRFTSEQDPHSTAVVFMMQQGKAYWAHCGDSRMYHFRGTRTMSVIGDHSLVAELVRKGRLDDRAALRHPQRNVLLSCLGSDREPRIDYGREESPLGRRLLPAVFGRALGALHRVRARLDPAGVPRTRRRRTPGRARPRACRRHRRQHLARGRQADRSPHRPRPPHPPRHRALKPPRHPWPALPHKPPRIPARL